jgi:CheY-like chemotaxis protein
MGLQVLVVEDEPISRKALAALLSDSGYRPLAAGSAEEALTLLIEGNRPSLALVDLDLPGMSGLELIHWLRRLSPQVVPILVTATSPERIHLLRHENQGILYLRKPIDFGHLLMVLQEHRAEQ